MTTPGPPSLAGTVVRYSLARLGLVAAVAGLLVLAGVPMLIALLVALIVALPLSMFLFRGLRARLDAALAERGTQRAALRARLRGEERAGPDDATGAPDAPGEPDARVPAPEQAGRGSGQREGDAGRG